MERVFLLEKKCIKNIESSLIMTFHQVKYIIVGKRQITLNDKSTWPDYFLGFLALSLPFNIYVSYSFNILGPTLTWFGRVKCLTKGPSFNINCVLVYPFMR